MSAPPKIVYLIGDHRVICDGAFVKCPGCGLVARVDQEQFEGKVSIDCPECPYHETHDLRQEPPPERGLGFIK